MTNPLVQWIAPRPGSSGGRFFTRLRVRGMELLADLALLAA